MAIVAARKVNKDYRQGQVVVHALRDVTLDIERGDFLALAGPSGSGKTTLLNCIGGLDTVTSGEIEVGEHRLSQLSARQLARLRLREIGFVFQAYNLIPVLTAAENVEFILQLQGTAAAERRRRALDILERVGLSEQVNRRPGEMSGGQQQRVAVARAIVSKPRLVLADEPTANLDSTTGAGLLNMMRQLNETDGVTFVFSTHDQMVMDYSRRLIKLKDGAVEDEIRR